jgi:hypothetical protein
MAVPPERVFAWLVRADLWHSYYRHSSNVVLEEGAQSLGPGVRFRWRTLGIGLVSRVCQFERTSRVAWYADGFGVHAFHTWMLTPTRDGTRVRMDETHQGWVSRVLAFWIAPRLTRAHREWLAGLSKAAVGGDPPPR